MKRLTQILVALALIVAALLFGRNFIIKEMLSKSAKALRGFEVSVGDVQVGILRPLVHIRDLKITNPADFPEKQALEAKEVLIRYDFFSLFGNESHFPEIVLDVPKAVVVWNAAGDMNFERLAGSSRKSEPAGKKKKKKKTEEPAPESAPEPVPQPAPPSEKESAPPRTMRIDKLTLRIAEAQIFDYRKGTEPSVMTFPINMDRTYTDVTDPDTLAAKIAAELTANYIATIFNNVGKKMQDNGDTKKINKMFENLGKSIEGLFKKTE
jgi:uncharacterized protein involved in outer membrane biogenesis